MRLYIPSASVLLLAISGAVVGSTFPFQTDPFAGTNALSTPGRQMVGGEQLLSFLPEADAFQFASSMFAPGARLHFANGVAGAIPSNANVIVLRDVDGDANTLTPFGAANAADLLAGRITVHGPGVFLYFDSALDLPRLVYSADLSDNTADLRILARMVNLNGQTGRDALAGFTGENFALTDVDTPAVSSLSRFGLVSGALALLAGCGVVKRQFAR